MCSAVSSRQHRSLLLNSSSISQSSRLHKFGQQCLYPRLVFSALTYDISTPLLTQLHWLNVPECIELAVLVYRCLHQTAPPYLAEEFHQSSADEARQQIHSASMLSLVVRRTRLSTIGDQAFLVTAVRLWNILPLNVTSTSSMSVFRKR